MKKGIRDILLWTTVGTVHFALQVLVWVGQLGAFSPRDGHIGITVTPPTTFLEAFCEHAFPFLSFPIVTIFFHDFGHGFRCSLWLDDLFSFSFPLGYSALALILAANSFAVVVIARAALHFVLKTINKMGRQPTTA